jgi:hypothetical protein
LITSKERERESTYRHTTNAVVLVVKNNDTYVVEKAKISIEPPLLFLLCTERVFETVIRKSELGKGKTDVEYVRRREIYFYKMFWTQETNKEVFDT